VKYALQYDLMEEAVLSANYLVEINKKGFISWNGTDNIAYSFDTMIVADALLDMFEYSFQDKYYNAAHDMAKRMKGIIDGVGYLATMSSPEGIAWDNPNIYYTIPGAHYLKLIPIFRRLGLDPEYLEKFIYLQRNDGAFHCNPATRYSFTHFHCYALDGIQHLKKEYARGAAWALGNAMGGRMGQRLPAWSSDRSWSMPGANAQAAWHLANIGMKHEAQQLYDTVLEDQLPDGAIPIKTGGLAETWPTLFAMLYKPR
jgi:hypothetical protein